MVSTKQDSIEDKIVKAKDDNLISSIEYDLINDEFNKYLSLKSVMQKKSTKEQSSLKNDVAKLTQMVDQLLQQKEN